jgi:ribonuclease P protein component
MNVNSKTSLKAGKSITNVRNSNSSIKNKICKIYYKKNNSNLNFAIATPSKIFRTAVLRNRTKRQIRMIIASLPNKSLSILIVVNGEYLKNSFEQNKNEITNLYNKL